MRSDFDVFLQPGFWVSALLLTLGVAATTAVIWINSTVRPF